MTDKLETATFALGCFWGPDAHFAALEGVEKTRVGYAGGEKDDPGYHSLGNHTETVQIDFNSEKISYGELLEKFWDWHDPTARRKTQYASKIFYHDEEQEEKAENSKPEGALTEIQELEKFWPAEDYHQKYRLRNSSLMEKFDDLSEEKFRESREVAKANAFVAGHLKEENFDQEVDLSISDSLKRGVRKKFT